MSLLAELKRRNVIRVVGAYVVLSWLLLQIGDVVFEFMDVPDWAGRLLIAFLAIGFIPAVVFSWAYELTPEGVKRESEVDRSQSITPQTGRKLDYITIGMVVLGVLIVLADRFHVLPSKSETSADVSAESPASPEATRSGPAPSESEDISIAVLPFNNMSASEENEYFSDGVSEEILNVLARVPELKVAARTSSFAFKGQNQDVLEIARKLRVDHVLEGSVRRQGDRVRITAQLIQADDGFHVWSETFDRTLDDIFAIQDEIANAIAEALQVELGLGAGKENLTGTESVAAYELYLQGTHHWYLRTYDDLVKAVDFFERSIAADPEFARAHAALAMTYAVIEGYGNFPGDATELTIEQARKALALDPESASALAALGSGLVDRRQFEQAEASYRRAIEVDPQFATAYQWLGNMLEWRGRPEEGLTLLTRATELEPAARVMAANRAFVLHNRGRHAESLAEVRRLLEYAPDYYDALFVAFRASRDLGAIQDSDDYMRRLAAAKGPIAEAPAQQLIEVLNGGGDRDGLLRFLMDAPPYSFNDPDHPNWLYTGDIAALLVRLDEPQLAMETLQDWHDSGFGNVLFWLPYPEFEALHCMPEFQALADEVGLVIDPGDCDAS